MARHSGIHTYIHTYILTSRTSFCTLPVHPSRVVSLAPHSSTAHLPSILTRLADLASRCSAGKPVPPQRPCETDHASGTACRACLSSSLCAAHSAKVCCFGLTAREASTSRWKKLSESTDPLTRPRCSVLGAGKGQGRIPYSYKYSRRQMTLDSLQLAVGSPLTHPST
jgi:hypothetical protein